MLAFADDLVIFYSANRPDGPGIYTANNDGSNVQNVPVPHGITAADPHFNPDETKILYSASVESGDNSEIYVADADGSNEVRITDNNAFDGEATDSPMAIASSSSPSGMGTKRSTS